MKNRNKYILFSTVLVLTTVLFCANVKSPGSTGKENAPETRSSLAPGKASVSKTDEMREESISVENSSSKIIIPDVTKYILKYDKKDVILICEYPDGRKTEQKVKSINAKYLTEVDLKELSDGIELSSSEELYKLIEDLSS